MACTSEVRRKKRVASVTDILTSHFCCAIEYTCKTSKWNWMDIKKIFWAEYVIQSFKKHGQKKIFLVAQKQIKPHTFSYLIEVIKLCIDEFNWLRGSNFSTFLQQQKSFCVDSLIRLSFNYNNFIVFDNSPIFSWFYWKCAQANWMHL